MSMEWLGWLVSSFCCISALEGGGSFLSLALEGGYCNANTPPHMHRSHRPLLPRDERNRGAC